MSEKEQNEWIAEKVMNATEDGGGYLCIDGRLIVGWWNPRNDLNHAEKALVQWEYETGGEAIIYKDKIQLIDCNGILLYCLQCNRGAAAITEALCMATGGVV